MNETKIMGNSKDFTIEGSYTFFSMVEINTSDVIEIKCIGDYVSLKFYGFLIRYLFSIRENYFGDTIHFKTFEEYTQTLEDDGEERGLNVPDVEDIDYWNIVKTDNDVDVFFFFQVRHGLIILPGNIYNSTNHIGLTFDSLDIDIRFCNYYMDLQADLSPIEGVLIDSSTNCLDNLCNTAAYKQAHFHGKPDINIDGLTIHAHRIFGLPPEEITYLCIWEFAVDSLLIEGFPTVDALGTSISTIIFGFKDVENALHSELPTTYDGMTIAFRCESTIINLVPDLNDPSTTMNVDLGFIQFNLCDIFNRRYSKKITAFIPAIEIQLIEKLSTNTNRIIGHMKSSLVFNNICQDAGMPQRRQDLIDHMKRNDAPFHRCPFMLYPEDRNQAFNDAYGCFLTSLTLPKIPPPLTADTYMEDSDVSDSIDLESDISDISDNDNENDIYYSRSSGKFSPTINYNDEDFTPASKYDPSNEYDNFILEFDEVQSFLTPRGLLSLSKLVEMKQPNIDTLLDKFQEEIVGKLKKYLTSKSLITNTRVVCPEITIRLGEFEVSEAREVFAKSQLVPTINVQIIEPSIALSKSVVKKSGEMSVDTQGGSVVALHVKEVIGNVSNPQGFVMPVYISMKDIELWISEEKEIVGSVNVEEIEADIKADQMEWLIKYALHLQDVLAPTIDQLHKHHKGEKEATAEMIYRLSMAAVDHHIDHDPGVLTKPAYILRAKRDHVRYFDIWKVMTRIRHIKNNLPQNWFTTNPLGDLNWQLPPSAYEDVLDIFSRWRSWEANQTQRSFMFKNIFSEEVPVEKDMEMQIEVGNISIKLANKSDGSDSIVIEKLGGNVKKQASNQVGVVVNVGSYNSRLSTISMDTIHSVVRSMSANTSKDESLSSEDGSSSSKEPLSLFLTLTITDFYQQVSLPFSSLELVAKDISNSVNVLETSTLISTDLAMVEVGVWGKDHKFLTTKVHDIGLIFADTTFKRIDLMIGSITSKSQDQRGLLPLAIEKIMSQDVAYIENMIPKQTTTTSTTTTTDFSLADLCSVVVSVEITEVNWLMEVIPHLAIRGLVRESKLELSTIDNDLSINWYTQKADIAASLDRSQLFEVQNSHIWINCDVDMARDLYLVKSSANVGNTKFLVPEITRTSERIHARKDHILNSIKKFEAIMKKDESVKVATTTGTTTTTTTNLLDRIAFKFRFTNDYIGVVTLVSDARYSYEMETVSFGIQNVASTLAIDQTIIHTLVPTYGELVVAAARIFIIHKSIPMTISNLLDVNVAIKVFNDNDKDKPKAGSRSLQVESQYCRVCLGPSSLFKIINFVDAIMVIMNKFDSDSNSDSDSETSTPPMDYSEITKILSSVQLLSYNFCLGWLFPTPSKEYPGIILGAERFFVVAEERLGKFTLIDAYLSVANGSSASNFFSLSSEKNNLNRALLPNMQFVYSVENSVDIRRNMRILITGDELDVKFLSTSMVIVEHLGTSINHVQRFLRSRQLSIIKKDHPPPPAQPQTQTQDYVSSFQSAFDSVEFLATFAGSNVLLYRLDTDESGEAPSLFLHSPAVKIAFQYKHHKFEKVKHIIKGEILTFPSDNTVYSSCVPVIIDIVEGVTRMMQNSKHHSDTPSNNNVNVNVSGAGGAMNFDSVFGDMDIHFGLKIDKQQLSLSCEPTAKVATVVGIESIYIQLNSTEPGLALTILFDSISASLQHIYSREISGSISIEKVILSSCLDIYDGLQFRSSGCLVDVDGYINVKQYQDVELFKDIWFPKKHLDVYSNNNGQPHISQSMSLTNRFKEVSNSYAVPWVVTFFVTNISLRVDFGQSLCDTSLNVDMLWAVSKKSTNWSQDLKLGVNTINLECKGRLGGNLKIKDINIHTAINWMSDDIILDIPLILVSIGIEKLHLKLSFDYHVFAIANIEDFSMSIFNQKSELSNLKDRLFVLFRFEAAEIYITSLTASNCLDIYNTISRMVQDNQRSYKEILRDGKGMKQKSSSDYDKEMLETIKKLETQIEVFAGHVLIHVYPTSFNDSKVLVVKLDESKANFQQNEYTSGVSNELDIQFNDLTVSLSVTQPVSDEFITDCTVNDFVDYAHKAKGGQIFLFPSFKISMRTFQKDNENIIEFLYQSTFDGTVDIRWNLGSVNFIREMFSIHQNAVASRTVYRKVGEQVGFKEDIFKSQDGQASTIMRQQLNEEDPTSEIDQAINNTISKVSEESQFQYLPLAPPIIEAPQLKELGNATPPLEWFGLHRNKFPNVTHQIGIVALQKIIREVEIRYSKILGRA
ncbi:uncharacterized protein RJT21DRAFT_118287 [Scheffersomyces amazonensis]|uniref:uncharacterized protein n=1 Tax=Scheffersomyces amazonensis TaxID=1078765 RepID=UPI00315D8862